MGGAIASVLTVKFPERVRRLVLIDPVGIQSIPLSWIYKAALLPGISELILGMVSTDRMVQSMHIMFLQSRTRQNISRSMSCSDTVPRLQARPFSTLHNKTVDGIPEVYQRLGKLDMPVLLIWGRNDQTLPLEQSRDILSAVPRCGISHRGKLRSYSAI